MSGSRVIMGVSLLPPIDHFYNLHMSNYIHLWGENVHFKIWNWHLTVTYCCHRCSLVFYNLDDCTYFVLTETCILKLCTCVRYVCVMRLLWSLFCTTEHKITRAVSELHLFKKKMTQIKKYLYWYFPALHLLIAIFHL